MEKCIETDWPKRSNGYHQKTINGRTRLAHRWAWEQANGPIPAGMVVMHLCDNRSCVNLGHLRVGTHTENNRDCLDKGRGRRGVRAHERSTLTEETAVYAMARMLVGEPRKVIADDLGCTQQALADVYRGRTFARCFQGESV